MAVIKEKVIVIHAALMEVFKLFTYTHTHTHAHTRTHKKLKSYPHSCMHNNFVPGHLNNACCSTAVPLEMARHKIVMHAGV